LDVHLSVGWLECDLQHVLHSYGLHLTPASSNNGVEGVLIAQGVHRVVDPTTSYFYAPLVDPTLYLFRVSVHPVFLVVAFHC
jgi:hypothetical protein